MTDFFEDDKNLQLRCINNKTTITFALKLHYRRYGKGEVELNFDDLKNVCDLNRLRSHNGATITGKIFINFIALILLSSLKRTVAKIEEKDRYYWSAADMLDKVETYSKVHFVGKYKDSWSTPTLKQRQVFEILGVKYVYKARNDLNKQKEYESILLPLFDNRPLHIMQIEYEIGTQCALVTYRFKDNDVIWKAFFLKDGCIMVTDSEIVNAPYDARKMLASRKVMWEKIK